MDLEQHTQALGYTRYLATWIDDIRFRKAAIIGGWSSDAESMLDYAELSDSEMCKKFASMDAAKSWAASHAAMDHYGTPRVETQTLTDDGYGEPYVWERTDQQEFCDGEWVQLEA